MFDRHMKEIPLLINAIDRDESVAFHRKILHEQVQEFTEEIRRDQALKDIPQYVRAVRFGNEIENFGKMITDYLKRLAMEMERLEKEKESLQRLLRKLRKWHEDKLEEWKES